MFFVVIGFLVVAVLEMLLAFHPRMKGRGRWGDSNDGPRMSALSHFLIGILCLWIAITAFAQMYGMKFSDRVVIGGFVSLLFLAGGAGVFDTYRDKHRPK